eukprot:gnl/TRDRNA2_/TRDRNA2_158183_c0_seq4.p1 gnl/TRDRNA2_/TRDRNA2_158183_c0~~gnl/TRDRNA2_/TRDRNA2_158183_c0_seq4.p1  ORF type:complete len:739 (+),score=145.67 gnl/TRDRNA2_/TRDRNA2_158183_c0_seq4:63-2279(+)
MTPLDLREAVAANRGCSGDVAASKQFAPSARIDKVCSPPRAVLESLEWEETMGSVASERSETECIRVAARFRPLDQNELQAGEDKLCVRFGRDGKSCALTADTAHGPAETNFAYDFMFQPESTQQDVYQAVARPIVDGVISGFNGAILAYGQTGSGKTHTMLGPGGAAAFLGEKEVDMAEVGVIPRALQDLVGYAATSEGHVKLRASYVEIYMERVIDLLSTRKGGADVKDHSHSAAIREASQNLYLPEVTEVPVASVREAMEVMKLGNTNRHVAATSMNRQSSRSHAVFVVTVTNTTDENCQKFAQLYLVDLAGSERLQKTNATGRQLEEAKLINTSLLALGQVIAALAHRHMHVPYRDSKLTQLLRNCLGGNARTAVLVAASPHAWNANESLSALRFGARASLITNTAQMNVAQDPEMLKRLLEKARMDLNELRGHCWAMQVQLAAVSAAEVTRKEEATRALEEAVATHRAELVEKERVLKEEAARALEDANATHRAEMVGKERALQEADERALEDALAKRMAEKERAMKDEFKRTIDDAVALHSCEIAEKDRPLQDTMPVADELEKGLEDLADTSEAAAAAGIPVTDSADVAASSAVLVANASSATGHQSCQAGTQLKTMEETLPLSGVGGKARGNDSCSDLAQAHVEQVECDLQEALADLEAQNLALANEVQALKRELASSNKQLLVVPVAAQAGATGSDARRSRSRSGGTRRGSGSLKSWFDSWNPSRSRPRR